METGRIYAGMQFSAMKTMLALVGVYGVYAGIYLASPAPPYATAINAVLFLVFGTVVWYIGFEYGTYRAKRLPSSRDASADRLQTEQGASE